MSASDTATGSSTTIAGVELSTSQLVLGRRTR